ncbi:MAG TPA: pyruvate kinase [Candidatus Nanoarchaeia archaeon]|nr:pyruvate kinase [Candidatus Nanoarchaeia archaeon]
MIRTKIVCTIGPCSETVDILSKLAKAGMNIARLNFSHGNHDEHLARIKRINEANESLPIPVGIMLDTQGPEIRLGTFEKKENLVEGEEVVITPRDVVCTSKVISISYKKIGNLVKPGDYIYIADGTIELKVKGKVDSDVVCEVVIGGEVNTRKNVAVPGAIVDLPSISNKDKEDIKFGIRNGIDFVAQSFVKSEDDVYDMKKLLAGTDILTIAKIEDPIGLKNIDEIIGAADGIMVARGDLGVQIPIQEVPSAQKMIIRKCNEAGKPVIVATQMLESMTRNPRPTRAEVTDVANAISDGADAIMLSGETAIGKYPLRAVEMMTRIAKETEGRIGPDFSVFHDSDKVEDALSKAVCHTAYNIKANAIITCTLSGHTARMISRYKPQTPIVAVTPNLKEIRKLNLWWGVHPLLIEAPSTTDDLIQNSVDIVMKKGLVKKGDIVVLTAGIPFTTPGNMNLMKIHEI